VEECAEAGEVEDARDTSLRGSADDELGAAQVRSHDFVGVLRPHAHHGGRVKHRVAALHGLFDPGLLGHVAHHEVPHLDFVGLESALQLLFAAHEQAKLVSSPGQGHGSVGAREAGSAGHHYAHDGLPSMQVGASCGGEYSWGSSDRGSLSALMGSRFLSGRSSVMKSEKLFQCGVRARRSAKSGTSPKPRG